MAVAIPYFRDLFSSRKPLCQSLFPFFGKHSVFAKKGDTVYNRDVRKEIFEINEYYHVSNKSAGREILFVDTKDFARFLYLILHLQSSKNFPHIARAIPFFEKHGVFNTDEFLTKEIIQTRVVELSAFVIMPDHFHLVLKEVKKGGISSYMQRLQNAYAKYWNAKYKKSGHLFRGPFRSLWVNQKTELPHLSPHLPKNPKDVRGFAEKELSYPWSSYIDYVGKNRFGRLLSHEIITEEFSGAKEYKKFVEEGKMRERAFILGKHTDL